jgi:hypothetical protein
MKYLLFPVATGFLSLLAVNAFSQGCSDAGFCTIGNLAISQTGKLQKDKNQLTFSVPAGAGDEGVFIVSPALEYTRAISGKWSVQGKLTANYASGNLGSAFGPGDVFISGTYLFNPSAAWKLSATLGTKLPLSQGNLKADGRSLPMQYQSSLGTVDLIAGLSLSNVHWQFAAGWQQPLTGINRNNFLPEYWDDPSANKYPPSNDFDRKGDVLLRAAYLFSAPNKLSFTAGLLGIYHLGEDTYINANIRPGPIPLKGSQGLTLNVTASVRYPISKRISAGITGGLPLAVRDVRPDGLTRSFVIAPEIRMAF